MSTTTGSKSVNAYVEKGKDDVYYWFGSWTCAAAISGPAPGRVPVSP